MLADSLRKAKESSPPQGSFQPLIDQLDKTAKDLRAGGNSSEAEKIERAASSIREAASLDLTVIDKAASSVTKQVSSLND